MIPLCKTRTLLDVLGISYVYDMLLQLNTQQLLFIELELELLIYKNMKKTNDTFFAMIQDGKFKKFLDN